MMKKIFALIITFLFLTTNIGYCFSELYYLYDIPEQQVNSIVRTNLQNWGYDLKSENPYYAVYKKNPNDNAVIIVQQSGDNVFYYYYSANKNNTELNQSFLRTFRSYRIRHEKQVNSNILNVYDNIAQKTMNSSGSSNMYTFDDEDYTTQTIPQQNTYSNNTNQYNYNYPTTYSNNSTQYNYNPQTYSNNTQANNNSVYIPAYPPQNNVVRTTQTAYNNTSTNLSPEILAKAQRSSTTLRGSVVSISSGTKIKAYLQNPINTSAANKGDRTIAVLTDDLRYNGISVIPQGSLVYGTLSKARHATYGSRNGRVVIEFNQIVTPENKMYEIATEKIDFTVTNDGKVARTVGNAVAGAAVGALAGLLFGALGNGNLGTSTAIGAGIGAGSALIGSGVERGVDAEIPSFTELEITLTKPFNVTVNQ